MMLIAAAALDSLCSLLIAVILSYLRYVSVFDTQVTTKGAGLNPNAKVWQEVPAPQNEVPEEGTEGSPWLQTTYSTADVTEGESRTQCISKMLLRLTKDRLHIYHSVTDLHIYHSIIDLHSIIPAESYSSVMHVLS